MRFIQIIWVLAKYILFYKATSYRNQILGTRLRLACEKLGLTFIKMGQILSMRYDLLSAEDARELRELLDNVKRIPIHKVYEILRQEYGRPHNEVFKVFFETPLGSASVSQVHKAELFDGSMVAVKIKRPEVDSQFASDIRIMKVITFIAATVSPTLRLLQVRQLVDYFEDWIKADLNFIKEVQNMEKVQSQYEFAVKGFRSDLGKAFLPKPFKNLSSARVIVMDYIDGIPLSKKAEILSRPDYDVEKSIVSYVNAAQRNWFRDDTEAFYFQADPHLSNILALPNGDAASIDFGLIAELTKEEARICQHLIIAVYLQDINRVMRLAAEMLSITGEEAEVMRSDVVRYLHRTQKEGFGFWFMEFVKIAIQHKFKFPLYLTTFGRTNLLIDGLIHEYLPGKTTIDLLGKEMHRQAMKEVWKNVAEADWMRLTYTVSQKIKEGPAVVSDFLDNPLRFVSQMVQEVKKM